MESEVLEEYKRMKWTRVISMQGWESNSARAWDIGPDVVTELRNMNDRDGADYPTIKAVFDPGVF